MRLIYEYRASHTRKSHGLDPHSYPARACGVDPQSTGHQTLPKKWTLWIPDEGVKQWHSLRPRRHRPDEQEGVLTQNILILTTGAVDTLDWMDVVKGLQSSQLLERVLQPFTQVFPSSIFH